MTSNDVDENTCWVSNESVFAKEVNYFDNKWSDNLRYLSKERSVLLTIGVGELIFVLIQKVYADSETQRKNAQAAKKTLGFKSNDFGQE